MSDFETIILTVEKGVGTISLNLPKAINAISQVMRVELKQAIQSVEQNDDVRVVVMRAEGRGFSSGTNLLEGLAGYHNIDEQIQQEYRPLIVAIGKSDKIYISSIHGACSGIGAALALASDLAIMSDDGFLYLPFAGLSMVPDGGISHHLVNAMGYKKAYQAFVESARITAEDCLQYGLINKVVAADNLVAETTTWAEKLAQGAPLAQKFGKRIMRGVHTSSFMETFDSESETQVTCSSSQDAGSAVNAFFAKEKAVFVGK